MLRWLLAFIVVVAALTVALIAALGVRVIWQAFVRDVKAERDRERLESEE